MDQYNSLNGEKLFQSGNTSLVGNATITNNTSGYIQVTNGYNSKIAAALVKAQSEMGNATKESKNPFFKSSYANLNSVREAVLPPLNRNGIAVLQPINGDVVTTTLLHESGEQISSDTRIVCAKQNDPQAYGSAVSYARRYGLQSMVCVGAEDDDGEKAIVRETKSTTKTASVAQQVALAEQKIASGEITTANEYFDIINKTGPIQAEPTQEAIPAKRGWAGKKSTTKSEETKSAGKDLF